ncbi:uncharacterized protein LOC131619354 [Vicia villosa]|uniref:uncharacterized protein LOC131619354 n=1 Tax=Vicia villosa TaxID=3911 RepID=UPI00273B0426|nr:uncharacterized protein LOC131619354 [Vicia villosa]
MYHSLWSQIIEFCSFCKKCLQSSIDRSGQRCPLCRKWIRGESSDVNIVLWNTIQHIFPREVEARKAANALSAQPCEASNRPFFGRRIFHLLLDISMSALSLLMLVFKIAPFKAFIKPKSDVIYDAEVPFNLTGIKISAIMVRSKTLLNKGVQSYKEFEMPIGVTEKPYVNKLVLVYHNLAYDATNLFASNLPELDLRAYEKPILVNFSNVTKSLPFGSLAKCVYFDLYGYVKFDTLLNRNVCTIFQQGHVSIVVESKDQVKDHGKHEFKMKIEGIICLVCGIVLLMIMFGLFIRLRRKKRLERKQLEFEDDNYETLKMSSFGHTKVPMALGTRTKPMIEMDFVP